MHQPSRRRLPATITVASTPSQHILAISLSKHLTGHPIATALAKDWSKAPQDATTYTNVGFNVDYNNFERSLDDIRKTFRGQNWSGVLVGWCLRGDPQYTEMFERVVATCHEELAGESTSIMFSTGPDNVAETVVKNTPVED